MKKTINVAIGGCNFIIDEDAYNSLDAYLESFKAALGSSSSSNEVMEELEARIADLFKEKLAGREVVDINMTKSIIDQLGMPEGSKSYTAYTTPGQCERGVKKFFRDPDNAKRIGHVGVYFMNGLANGIPLSFA